MQARCCGQNPQHCESKIISTLSGSSILEHGRELLSQKVTIYTQNTPPALVENPYLQPCVPNTQPGTRTLAHTHIYSLLASSKDPFSNTSLNRFLMTRIFLLREEWEYHQGGRSYLRWNTSGAGGCSTEDLQAPAQITSGFVLQSQKNPTGQNSPCF